MNEFWKLDPCGQCGSSGSSGVWAVVSLHIRAVCRAALRGGRQGVWATHPFSSSPAVIISSGTMTAGEADVNSNIRFQSARAVSTLLRNEEV